MTLLEGVVFELTLFKDFFYCFDPYFDFTGRVLDAIFCIIPTGETFQHVSRDTTVEPFSTNLEGR
jgi:hypothetical protein